MGFVTGGSGMVMQGSARESSHLASMEASYVGLHGLIRGGASAFKARKPSYKVYSSGLCSSA